MNRVSKNKIKYVSVILIAFILINISSLGLAQAAISNSSLLTLTNSARNSAGLSSLNLNSQLQSAAQAKAENMFQDQYFAHTSKDGRNPWDFIKAAGYNYVYAGENLAIGYSDTSELQNAWMNSPSHRENILSPNFREIGFASVDGIYEGAQTTIVVEMFGSTQSTQAVTQNVASVEKNADVTSNKNVVVDNSKPVVTKNFDIINENTSYLPNKIFQGDKVEFNVALKGEVKDVYIMVGNQKIDFKDQLLAIGKDQTGNLKQTVTINEVGNLDVKLTVVGVNDFTEVKNLGLLEVNAKVVASKAIDSSLMANIIKNITDNFVIYISAIILVFVSLVGYFVIRFRKYGKLI